jgi:hypothetical protein
MIASSSIAHVSITLFSRMILWERVINFGLGWLDHRAAKNVSSMMMTNWILHHSQARQTNPAGQGFTIALLTKCPDRDGETDV